MTDSVRQMVDHARAALALDLQNARGEATMEVSAEAVQIVLAALNAALGPTSPTTIIDAIHRDKPRVGFIHADGSIQGRFGPLERGTIWVCDADLTALAAFGWTSVPGETQPDHGLTLVSRG